jgi:hypothetical protein
MSSVKYNLPLLDWDTRFSLWQVKMRAVMSQTDLDDALDGFGKKVSRLGLMKKGARIVRRRHIFIFIYPIISCRMCWRRRPPLHCG